MKTSLLLSASMLVMGLSGCAGMLATTVPEASGDFNPTGEISFQNTGASFDGARVRNPKCNLSKRTDGSWAGRMGSAAIDVSVTPTKVRGVDFVLSLEKQDDKETIIVGQMQGRVLRFEIKSDSIMVRTSTQSFTLGRAGPNSFGNHGELQLKGEAGAAIPPWPQIGLALVAAFDGGGGDSGPGGVQSTM